MSVLDQTCVCSCKLSPVLFVVVLQFFYGFGAGSLSLIVIVLRSNSNIFASVICTSNGAIVVLGGGNIVNIIVLSF